MKSGHLSALSGSWLKNGCPGFSADPSAAHRTWYEHSFKSCTIACRAVASLSTTSTRKLSGLISGVIAVAVSTIFDPFIRLSSDTGACKSLPYPSSDTAGAKILGLDCNRAENILVQDPRSDVAMAGVQILFAARPGRSGHCNEPQMLHLHRI